MNLPYTHESIRLTGRWDLRDPHAAVTTAPGSYFEFAFEGRMALLRFDVVANGYPRLHLWIQLDGGAMTEAPIDSHLRVMAAEEGKHICRVIYKGGSEKDRRWTPPLTGKVSFIGIQTEHPLPIGEDPRPVIEFVGDSITEGVLIDVDFECDGDPVAHVDECKRCYQDDACATYAWHTARELDLRPIIMGYGAVGVIRLGCGGVPTAPEAYPYCYEGAPITHGDLPKYVVINHGTNDRSKTAEVFLPRYERLLEVVREHNPHAVIIVLSPFCGAFHTELGELVEAYRKKDGGEIHYIDTNGWIDPLPIHPLRPGHIEVARRLVPLLREIMKR